MAHWFKHVGRLAVVLSTFTIGLAFVGGCEDEQELETPAGEVEIEE